MILEACLLILIIATAFMLAVAKIIDLRQTCDFKSTHSLLNVCAAALPLLIAIFCIRSFAFEIVLIPSASMQPTLQEGDLILIDKFSYGARIPILGTRLGSGYPQRDDIIVYRGTVNNKNIGLIKRIVGLPGDSITYQDRILYINNQPCKQYAMRGNWLAQNNGKIIPVIQATEACNDQEHGLQFAWHTPMPTYKYSKMQVAAESYYVLGDYRDNSLDSRENGLVPDQKLVGKARLVLFSINWIDKKIRWDRMCIRI